MTDRLKEIKSYPPDEIQLEFPDEEQREIELKEEPVFSFFNVVGEIKNKLETIQVESSTLDRKYAENMTDLKVNSELANERKGELDVLRSTISANLSWIKEKLDLIQKDNRRISEEQGPGSAEYRIRTNQFAQLQEQFQDAVQEFARVQNDYKEKQEETLKRHIRIVNSQATEEEVERMLSDPTIELDQLFSQAIIGSSALHTRDAIYNRVKETRDDLLKLEDSMNELVELFRDLNTLVHSQQGLINNIEKNVTLATDYIEKGTQNTKEAKKYQGKSRYMFFLIMCACALIIIAVVVVLILVFAILTPTVFLRA